MTRFLRHCWVHYSLTRPFDGKPHTRLHWKPGVSISERYALPYRLYLRRWGLQGVWLWALFVTLTSTNVLALLWFFTWHAGDIMAVGGWTTAPRWLVTTFSAEQVFMETLAVAVSATSLLCFLAKKGTQVMITDRIRVGGVVFGRRFPLAGSTVSMRLHRYADREQKREEKKQREAQMKGHKRLPTVPQYFRRSFHVVLTASGQPHVIATIFNEEAAEKLVTRLQWAIDEMHAFNPATEDWEQRKRKIAGLE